MISEKTSLNIEKTIKNLLIKETHFTNNERRPLIYFLCADIINKFVSISVKLYLHPLFFRFYMNPFYYFQYTA